MSSWIRRISTPRPQSANILQSASSVNASGRYCLLASLLFALAAVGCGGGSNSATTAPAGLQAPTAPAAFNAYVGTSPFDVTASGASPTDPYNGNGVWTLSIDHSTSLFDAQDVTTGKNNTDGYSAYGNVAGSFSTSGGFLNLTQTNDPAPPRFSPVPPAGFAFEIPGRVAVLRQGDNTIPVTALVPAGCPSINGNTKFNFVVLPTSSSALNTLLPWNPAVDASYGSLQIANSGSNWTFTSFQQSILAGAAGPNNAATLPAGTCAPTAAGTAVWVPSDPTTALPKTVAVGPSGFYIADQGQDASGNGYPGEFGVIQPSAALSTSDVLSHRYLGFTFEPGADSSLLIPETQLASFSASAPAGQLVGGGFPINFAINSPYGFDDPTQPAGTNLTVDLGPQDPINHGVYPQASVTDANSPSGAPYNAVAVVGNPEGKYAILIIGYDTDYGLPFGLYLFQQ